MKKIDRTGGDYGAGLIPGVAVVSRGEALGHGLWVDAVMLQQILDAINAAMPDGVKAHFAHYDSGRLGSFLGRFKTGRRDGDVIRADLHIAQAAHNAPDGNFAEYVMQLAETDSGAFGASIVFDHDTESEGDFALKYLRSPDPLNKSNLRHARLKRLHAIDAIDTPATNPNGLFHRLSLHDSRIESEYDKRFKEFWFKCGTNMAKVAAGTVFREKTAAKLPN